MTTEPAPGDVPVHFAVAFCPAAAVGFRPAETIMLWAVPAVCPAQFGTTVCPDPAVFEEVVACAGSEPEYVVTIVTDDPGLT